jgi:hypothetical protein
MLIVDRLLVGGLKFVLDKVAQAVETELNDEDKLREELLALQMRYEVGELSQAEFEQVEGVLLARLRAIREEREGTGGVEMRVTGVEASFGGDEDDR